MPRRRRAGKRNLHERMQELRDGLEDSLGARFEDELRRASDKVNAAISPYTRFVRSELGRLENLQGELKENQATLQGLTREVENLSSQAAQEY